MTQTNTDRLLSVTFCLNTVIGLPPFNDSTELHSTLDTTDAASPIQEIAALPQVDTGYIKKMLLLNNDEFNTLCKQEMNFIVCDSLNRGQNNTTNYHARIRGHGKQLGGVDIESHPLEVVLDNTKANMLCGYERGNALETIAEWGTDVSVAFNIDQGSIDGEAIDIEIVEITMVEMSKRSTGNSRMSPRSMTKYLWNIMKSVKRTDRSDRIVIKDKVIFKTTIQLGRYYQHGKSEYIFCSRNASNTLILYLTLLIEPLLIDKQGSIPEVNKDCLNAVSFKYICNTLSTHRSWIIMQYSVDYSNMYMQYQCSIHRHWLVVVESVLYTQMMLYNKAYVRAYVQYTTSRIQQEEVHERSVITNSYLIQYEINKEIAETRHKKIVKRAHLKASRN